ncbi:MAG: alkaline invertase [Gammaproteobacteria bacterium]|nr:alkaline invertase [Gammaproteobacteria bacterium]
MQASIIDSAYELLDETILYHNGQPVGTTAAVPTNLSAVNYGDCFIRDFFPSALVFLMKGEYEIVRNFLTTVLRLCDQQERMPGHDFSEGLMPASFEVAATEDGGTKLIADFGDRAIGRVAPVDSAAWWMILLRVYSLTSGDLTLAHSDRFQEGMRKILNLYLHESFEMSPAMLVPDAAFMIDRRMGVYGHPLEIQALFYGMLATAQQLLLPGPANDGLLRIINKRMPALCSYVRLFYWLDEQRLNEIHRYKSEEFGWDAQNLLNIYPETIPDWLDGWLCRNDGYMVGNIGPGKIDFRYFAGGNLLSIIFGLTTDAQGDMIMRLYDSHWDQLAGRMPFKLVYPAVSGQEWALLTGCDPKNSPWSYHNGGNWPCLLWMFTCAAIRTGHADLAARAVEVAGARLLRDRWPEYYDGQMGSLIGRRANLNQTWTATALIIAHQLLDNPDSLAVFEALIST